MSDEQKVTCKPMNKYTCDLSAKERGEMFSELYKDLSKTLTRLEEVLGGNINWTEEYILQFFDVFNYDMQVDTGIMAIRLLHILEKTTATIQHLNTLNELGSLDD